MHRLAATGSYWVHYWHFFEVYLFEILDGCLYVWLFVLGDLLMGGVQSARPLRPLWKTGISLFLLLFILFCCHLPWYPCPNRYSRLLPAFFLVTQTLRHLSRVFASKHRMFAFLHFHIILCLCLCTVHCYGTHGQLWLHFTRGMSGCVDAPLMLQDMSFCCHCRRIFAWKE